MKWKIGVADYGMSVWEGGLYDIQSRLELLRDLGFDGTERLEAMTEADALHKAALYRRMGMGFATCRHIHSVQLSMEWSAALGGNYVWLTNGDQSRQCDFQTFIRRAKAFCAAAAKWHLQAALHNHLGMRIESETELHDFMRECPEASLLLDAGHLVGAGGDPVDAIYRYHKRIAAVHLKDIKMLNPEIGSERWSERLHFCELGAGNVHFDCKRVLEALAKVEYKGWIFVEQDHHSQNMEQELAASLAVIKEYEA